MAALGGKQGDDPRTPGEVIGRPVGWRLFACAGDLLGWGDRCRRWASLALRVGGAGKGRDGTQGDSQEKRFIHLYGSFLVKLAWSWGSVGDGFGDWHALGRCVHHTM